LIQSFYRCLRADRHKNWRFDIAMISMDNSGPSAGFFVLVEVGKEGHKKYYLD
jgi:hypothetical protein